MWLVFSSIYYIALDMQYRKYLTFELKAQRSLKFI